ncbi:hypothetical protein R84B8_01209 [Treponema sp. R8-4-B8]
MKYRLLVLWMLFLIAGNINAQELKIPPIVDLLKVTVGGWGYRPDIRIWGWSKTGKVAYSREAVGGYTGYMAIKFIVFDFVNDKVLINIEADADEVVGDNGGWESITSEYLFNYIKDKITNAMKAHSIVEQYAEFMPFPIKRNGMEYSVAISDIVSGEDMWGKIPIKKYTVSITANGKKKTIFTGENTRVSKVHVCGYFLSPFENRALIVLAEQTPPGFEGDVDIYYVFSGCHLETGFK